MATSDAPVVEMLWESHDPLHALDGRFGFGDEESAARWVGAAVGEHWGVQVDRCERIVISDHNALAWVGTSSGRMIAKWSVVPWLFARLAEIAQLTKWLDDHGLPVSVPVAALDGRLQVEVDGASMSLQRVVDADLLDIADPRQVRAAGAVLARLQDALAAYPGADRLARPGSSPGPLKTRITRWLDTDAGRLPAEARDTLRRLLADAPADELPLQLGHHDFRSANVLCIGTEVAAVIDFEEVRPDHRIVELARSAVLLGTRFHDWAPVSADVHEEFLTGYQSVHHLTSAEAAWWDALMCWQSLASFDRVNDGLI